MRGGKTAYRRGYDGEVRERRTLRLTGSWRGVEDAAPYEGAKRRDEGIPPYC